LKIFSKITNHNKSLISKKKVIAYRPPRFSQKEWKRYILSRNNLILKNEILIKPRSANYFKVKAGQFFRINITTGSQVGDLNLFNLKNLDEKFFSGKTRALYGTHLSTQDRLWSCLPYFRPMVTITHDTLDWYGYDKDGASVHDVIGTRCDPYTNLLLNKNIYHQCCHSNILNSLIMATGIKKREAEKLVHDVLNVFMCTGITKDTKQYFMKASPARVGDYLEFRAEIDLLGILSACPGGDCSSTHSSNKAKCHPLKIEIFESISKQNDKIPKSEISKYQNR
jgi:uncharacterized protein YcgI (DUF1989 family)